MGNGRSLEMNEWIVFYPLYPCLPALWLWLVYFYHKHIFLVVPLVKSIVPSSSIAPTVKHLTVSLLGGTVWTWILRFVDKKPCQFEGQYAHATINNSFFIIIITSRRSMAASLVGSVLPKKVQSAVVIIPRPENGNLTLPSNRFC